MATTLAALLFAAAPALPGSEHFAYDPKAPLDAVTAGVETRGDVVIQDFSYASPKGGRVPATLVVPAGKGPFAAVVWGHWYWENSPMKSRRQFLDEAVVLARSGVVSLLTDGPVARAGYVPDRTPLNAKQFEDLVQQVVDMRRGTDLLLARPDVDARRLAFVGHSYNATVGAILAGVDRRFKAFVLMAGSLSDQVDFRSVAYRRYREKVGAAKWDAFTAEHAWVDPGPYVAHAAPAAVFMQFATPRGLSDARAREAVRRERERAEAVQVLRRAPRPERRGAPRPPRVSRRDARREGARPRRGRRRPRPRPAPAAAVNDAEAARPSAASRSSRGS